MRSVSHSLGRSTWIVLGSAAIVISIIYGLWLGHRNDRTTSAWSRGTAAFREQRHEAAAARRTPPPAASTPARYRNHAPEDVLSQAIHFAELKPPQIDKATPLLSMLLSTHQMSGPELLDRVRSERLPPALHPAIFVLLSRSKNNADQQLLQSALLDRDLQPRNRLRAAAALGASETADNASLHALMRVLVLPSDSERPATLVQLQIGVMHALGNLERNARERAPALSQATRTALTNQLRVAATEDHISLVLAAMDAMQISGHPAFVEHLRFYRSHRDEIVRRYAKGVLDLLATRSNDR